MNAAYTGNKISELRKEKNMTQKDLALQLHVTDKAVSKWERGLNYPDLLLFPLLASALDTTVSELLGVEQNIPDTTIDIMAEISKQEKERILKIMREYLVLTTVLAIGFIIYQSHLFIYGYIWAKYNVQFWIVGVLLALAVTLITNGIYMLVKYRKMFHDIK